MVISIPKEYEDIKQSLHKAHPDWDSEKVEKTASETFSSIFETNPKHAEELEKQGKWEDYKKSHSKAKSQKESSSIFFSSRYEFKEEADGDYVEGFVSAPQIDLGNDLVDAQAQKEIVDELNSPFSAVANKLSYRHDWLKKKEGEIEPVPFGKIVRGELRIHPKFSKEAAWGKFRLNEEYPNYPSIKKQIKEGFIDGFSIEYKAKDSISKIIGNIQVRVIKSLELIGIGVAARPMNPAASMTNLMIKEYEYIDEVQNNMTENKSALDAKEVEIAELKKALEAKEAKLQDMAKLVSTKEAFEQELKGIKMKEKVLVQRNEAEIKELDAEVKEYFNAPLHSNQKWAEAAKLIKKLGVW